MTVSQTEVVETGLEGMEVSQQKGSGQRSGFTEFYNNKLGLNTSVSLPEAARPSQPALARMMVDCAILVNDRIGAVGDAIRESAEKLYELKKNVKHGEWTAFINSDAMIISARDAGDLANCWAKLLRNEERVTDEMAGSMSLRALAAFANADEEAKDIIIGKLMSGMKPTEKAIRDIAKGGETKRKSSGKSKEVDELKKQMNELLTYAEEQSEAKDMMDTLRQMQKINVSIHSSNKKLAEEKESLRNKVDTAQTALSAAKTRIGNLEKDNKSQDEKLKELLKELAPLRVKAELEQKEDWGKE